MEHLKSEIQLIIAPPEAVGRVVYELKAEVEKLRGALSEVTTDTVYEENERLRKALQQVMYELGVPLPGFPHPKEAYKLAKAALEASDG